MAGMNASENWRRVWEKPGIQIFEAPPQSGADSCLDADNCFFVGAVFDAAGAKARGEPIYVKAAAKNAGAERSLAKSGAAMSPSFAMSRRHAFTCCAIHRALFLFRRQCNCWVGEAAAYASTKEFKADLDVLDRSLVANQSGVIARGRLRLLRRAVDCFGFHLASLDMRQNSVVHERTVAELLDAAKPGTSYLALNEEARIAQLAAELRNARPLTSMFVKYSEETVGELDVFHAAAEAHARFGTDVIPQ